VRKDGVATTHKAKMMPLCPNASVCLTAAQILMVLGACAFEAGSFCNSSNICRACPTIALTGGQNSHQSSAGSEGFTATHAQLGVGWHPPNTANPNRSTEDHQTLCTIGDE
tara:strand:- start:135 stop:467 length:333 start_codon:yes stop_codon:yes gene_type:complete